MAAERKTHNVEDFRVMTNTHIRKSSTPEARLALANIMENVLMTANRYRGFHYCDAEGKVVAYDVNVTDHTMRQYY